MSTGHRVVQITDTHLLEDPAGRLSDVPTRDTLHAVLEHVAAHAAPVDRLVITGDIAHDERATTYEALAALLGEWLGRTRMVPGNHDDRAGLRAALAPDAAPGGPVAFSETLGRWRLVGLDSQVTGEAWGGLDAAQLDWLQSQLGRDPGAPAVVFVHHPPFPVGSEWIDGIGLRNGERLLEVVERAPSVAAIACGHVHQAFEGRRGRTALLTTPSTAFQFARGDVAHRYDDLPPGYRVLDLGDDGHLATRVVHLPELSHRPRRAAAGG